jgi:hypothetical protein
MAGRRDNWECVDNFPAAPEREGQTGYDIKLDFGQGGIKLIPLASLHVAVDIRGKPWRVARVY